MRIKTYFWEEAPGVQSSARIMQVVVLGMLIYFNHLFINLPEFEINQGFITINVIWLIGAFAPKYLQKFIESKALGPVGTKAANTETNE